jgi:CP family cyanate transporter-like MFS transporter
MDTDSYEEEPSPYRWVILLLVWIGYFGFGMISSALPVLISVIAIDLGLMGMILGVWILLYVPIAIPVGLLIDQIRVKRAIFLGLVFVALSGVLRGFAVNFPTMVLFAAIFGMGGPMVSIGMSKTIAVWFAGEERGLALGILLAGFFVGSGTVLALTNTFFLPLFGTWRTTLAFYGLFGIVSAASWILFARDGPLTIRDDTLFTTLKEGLSTLLKEKYVWVVGIIAFLLFVAGYAFTSWLPTLLQVKGMTPAVAGILASVPNWAGILGSVTIPRLGKAGWRRKMLFILFLIQGIWVFLVVLVIGLVPLTVVLVLYGICSAAIPPITIVLLMDLPNIGVKNTGAASGVFFSFGAVGGFIGPLIVGYLADLMGTLYIGFLLVSLVLELTLIFIVILREK